MGTAIFLWSSMYSVSSLGLNRWWIKQRATLPALLNELPTVRNRAYLCACRPIGGKNSLAPLFKIFSNAWRSAFAWLEIQISRQRWSSDLTEHCASAYGDISHIETRGATLMFCKKLCTRTIREVNLYNAARAQENLDKRARSNYRSRHRTRPHHKFDVGDHVRVSRIKNTFER